MFHFLHTKILRMHVRWRCEAVVSTVATGRGFTLQTRTGRQRAGGAAGRALGA